MITFQELIRRLTDYWEKQGCTLHLGHDSEVGAATFNPATFLRCLGPEPYKAAYVEPCCRPSDGRYGQNPNRVQLFHQFQTIIKPTPPNMQDLYIDSLRAIGLNLEEHDIRFVHDDWENPTIGAWGLGWEVWLDGMEVTQYTYFQAIGSVELKTVTAELAYGLERIAMYLQNVDNIFEVMWDDTLTLGDIARQNEIEWSGYNFERADSEMWARHFDDFEREAKRLISESFPIPAFNFVMKASHAFNMLDARGAISTTERTGYIGRIRDLSRQIAEAFCHSREQQSFPLLQKYPLNEVKLPEALKPNIAGAPNETEEFLLEIGSEELPATFVPIGMKNLHAAVEKLLAKHEIPHGAIHTYGTPRRLALRIEKLAYASPPKVIEKKGPALKSAQDESGNYTRAGLGFLRSVGLDESTTLDPSGIPKGIEVRGDYLYASLTAPPVSTAQLLAKELPMLIQGLDFPKKMHWDETGVTYPRPLTTLLCMLGSEEIPFAIGKIATSRVTHGHRQRKSREVTIDYAGNYVEALRSHFVMVDPQERELRIKGQLREIEKKTASTVVDEARVLREVVHLSEWPELLLAPFDAHFLEAPKEVLISEMVEHQRYFPLAKADGSLINQFIITADNVATDKIIKGNQKVLSARLSDGHFLYNQDLEIPLEKRCEKLKTMTFQKKLGSVYDKSVRIEKHAQDIAAALGFDKSKEITRAAQLAKADLASHLVAEFPDLQGIAGATYARAQGEEAEVASAIEEHWMPTSESAPLPQSKTGIVLSLADKLDNLIGYYSVGLKPTSSSDPYALRRASIGIVRILLDHKLSLNLGEIMPKLATHFHTIDNADEVLDEISLFITHRAKKLFEARGFAKEEVDAALSRACDNPYEELRKLEAIRTFRKSDEEAFGNMCEVYKRARGQLRSCNANAQEIQEALLYEEAERTLFNELQILEQKWEQAQRERNYLELLQLLSSLQPHLARLFDEVKISVEDDALRSNRTGLLSAIIGRYDALLDFSKIH